MAATATPVHVDIRPVLAALEAVHALTFGVVEAHFVTESGSSYAIRKTNTQVEFITDSKAGVPQFGYVDDAYMLHGRLTILFHKGGSMTPKEERITTSRVVQSSFHTL